MGEQIFTFQLISYQEFRQFMIQMWGPVDLGPYGERHFIPYRFGANQYSGQETLDRGLAFCLGAFHNGELIGANMTYNVSDTVVCGNGIFVSEKYRNQGVAHGLLKRVRQLWPECFTVHIAFYRQANFNTFLRKGLSAPEGWNFRRVGKRSSDFCDFRVNLLKFRMEK